MAACIDYILSDYTEAAKSRCGAPQCLENIEAPHLACIKHTTMFCNMICSDNGRSRLKAEHFCIL